MSPFASEFRTDAFLGAHPVVQFSYAHYAFVSIHPFSDGNGRVARALASAFTYCAISMPIVILSEHKNEYRDGLEHADKGNYRFVDFILAMSRYHSASRREPAFGRAEAAGQSLAAIQRLYVTRGAILMKKSTRSVRNYRRISDKLSPIFSSKSSKPR
jgi:hypothetical protein